MAGGFIKRADKITKRDIRRMRRRPGLSKGYNPSRYTPIVSLCPDRMFVKLKYSQSFRLSSLAGALDFQAFRGNDIEDCDATAVGAGPNAYGTEQWASFYGRFYVTSVHVKLTISPNDNGNSKIVMYPTIFNVTPANLDRSQSHARAQERMINGGEGIHVMKARFTTKAVTGERWNINQTKVLGAGVTINSPFYVSIAYAGVPENTPPDNTACNINATLTYSVCFYNRNQALSPPGSGQPA